MEDMQHEGGDDAFGICLDGLEGCISRIDWRQRLNTRDAFLPSYNLPIQEFAWVTLSQILFSDRLHRQVDENCVLPGYYAASSNNSLPTFRGNLSFPSSRVNYPNNHALHRQVLHKFSKSCYFDITIMQPVVPSSIFLGLSLFFVTIYHKHHKVL